MEHVWFFSGLLLMAFCFAQAEIQIEGPHGWAERLPTWRKINRLTRILYGGRPLTGYHLWVQSFSLAMVHLPFLGGWATWTPQGEVRALAAFVIFWIAEDFLWFVFNPAFGVRRFRREFIWWHAPAWWWIAPRDYWLFGPAAIAAYSWSV